jgi:hypothetical protein
VRALADQIALELRESPEDVEDERAASRRGVDALGQRDQVRHRAAEPVELPNDQRIAAAQVGERLGQASALAREARSSSTVSQPIFVSASR